MSEHRPPSQPTTLTDRVRALTGGLMARAGGGLYRLGVHPDAVTIAGLVVVMVAAVLIARGQLQAGGLLLLLGLPLDALDGAVARAMARQGSFGKMLDSSLDRYADGFIFAALSYHFAVGDDFRLLGLTLLALVGSFMVSYTRARAEGLGVDVRVGFLSRMERVLVILVMLLLPDLFNLPILEAGLWLLAVGTNLTALQRLRYVYIALKDGESTHGI